MAYWAFFKEPTCGNGSRAVDRHHDSGACGRRAECSRLSARHSFEGFDDRVLWRDPFCRSHYRTIFRATDGERECRRGSACSLLSAYASGHLSTGEVVTLAMCVANCYE